VNDRSYHRGVALLAGLWAVVSTAALIFLEPEARGLSPFWHTIAISTAYLVPAVLWSYAIVSAYASATKARIRGTLSLAVNSGQCLPAILFFATATPYALAALLAVGVNVAYILASIRTARQDRPDRRWVAFTAAVGLEALLVMRAFHEPLLAACAGEVAIVAGLALLCCFGWRLPDARTSWRNVAVVVTVTIALASWLSFQGRMGGAKAARAEAAPKASAPAMGGPAKDRAAGVETIAGNTLPGVILWPEVSASTTLVAPLPVWTRVSQGVLQADTSIPFSGEYWMFEPPDRRPPPTSAVRRGNPTKVTFRTVDDNPLLMEAHQKLPTTVDPRCCAAVEMDIRNVDPHPGMIVLEMVLVDAESGKRASLGERVASGTTLRYEIPRGIGLRRFDEIAVLFHREPRPLGFSAKLAIERFRLAK
jgi:hypothetical protein